MVDLVLNHVSSQHPWVERYLSGDLKYANYFIEPPRDYDVSGVRRPRATPLLTPFERPGGDEVELWTTFGPDQLDLNYREPRVLLEAMRVLLTHVRRDAYLVRLDAVGFVWKESGTESIHQPGAHTIVRLMRHVLDVAAPDVRLVAETNVPHAENVTYLGSGDREAQLVYNFALPPLLVHTMHTGDATALTDWARTLRVPLPSASFLNFTASHDGIGVTPVRGVLAPADVDAMIARVEAHGGLGVVPGAAGRLARAVRAERLVHRRAHRARRERRPARRAVPRLAGDHARDAGGAGDLPALAAGVAVVVRGRDRADGPAGDQPPEARPRGRGPRGAARRRPARPRHAARHGPRLVPAVLRIRRATPAFHPRAPSSVLELDPRVFAIERWTIDDEQRVLALHNVSPDEATVKLPGRRVARPHHRRAGDERDEPGRVPRGLARRALGAYVTRAGAALDLAVRAERDEVPRAPAAS